MTATGGGDDQKRGLLETARVVAIVGLSPDTDKASNIVGRYLMAHGYRVIPVNPAYAEILGQRSYPSLSDVPVKVDIVDIFRKSDEVLPAVKEAVGLAPKAIWLQLGVVNEEAERIARQSGIPLYMDQCIKKEHTRLLGEQGPGAERGLPTRDRSPGIPDDPLTKIS